MSWQLAIVCVWCVAFLPEAFSFAATQRFTLGHSSTIKSPPMSGKSLSLSLGVGLGQRKVRRVAITAVVFEPVAPNLAQTAVVLLSTVGLASYWWLVFVPSERRDLAKNKNKGGLNAYLGELESSTGRDLEKWFYTEWLQRRQKVRKMVESSLDSKSPQDVIDREIEKAIPTPNFFSLDNPILVAVIIMMSGVAFAGISGR
jgi:hypothetical protein